MRKLTIKRGKSFVGCLAKMKIYIEDASSDELKINNVSVKKIGEIKNGEEKAFEIPEDQLKVYVIADTLSKEYCNEYYQLEEGSEDVVLSGKNKFSIARGNAFCFDDNDSVEVLENRKKGQKKGFAVLIVAALVGFVVGFLATCGIFSAPEVKEKTFSKAGMKITLTNAFQEVEYEPYTAVFGAENIAVYILEEKFTLAEGFGECTLEEYAKFIFDGNNIKTQYVEYENGLKGFDYIANGSDGKQYKYFTYVFKETDAFWMTQFAVSAELADEYEEKIISWAKSIEFEV